MLRSVILFISALTDTKILHALESDSNGMRNAIYIDQFKKENPLIIKLFIFFVNSIVTLVFFKDYIRIL